jgi:hypothetical protein
MLYMVVERFKDEDAAPVYRRYHERGRLLPEGLRYVSSWVDKTGSRCFQLMETEQPALFETWIAHWSDLIDFEVYPVTESTP